MKAVCVAILMTAVAAGSAAAEDGVKRIAGPLGVTGSFEFVARPGAKDSEKDVEKLRRAASGIACGLSDDRCLIVFDEGRAARWATLAADRFEAELTPVIVQPGDENKELDLEGAARDGDTIYVVGSHAVGRNDCDTRDASRSIYRLKPGAEPEPGDLLTALKKEPKLATALGVCLAEGKGLDIEGVAFSGDRLHFGFRGPKPAAGKAYIFSVPAKALFGGEADATGELAQAIVGEGRAIRDVTAATGGFLLLVGPDDDEANAGKSFAISYWKDGEAREIGELPRFDRREFSGCKDKKDKVERKPEGLAVMSETDQAWTVVVVSDGLCDGGPTWYEVKKP